MVVELKMPELLKFIDEQVKAGPFPSADAAIEAAVEQMMFGREELDADTIAAINRADEQYEQGQFVEWKEVREQLRAKYLGK